MAAKKKKQYQYNTERQYKAAYTEWEGYKRRRRPQWSIIRQLDECQTNVKGVVRLIGQLGTDFLLKGNKISLHGLAIRSEFLLILLIYIYTKTRLFLIIIIIIVPAHPSGQNIFSGGGGYLA